jgi:hypothetical protein
MFAGYHSTNTCACPHHEKPCITHPLYDYSLDSNSAMEYWPSECIDRLKYHEWKNVLADEYTMFVIHNTSLDLSVFGGGGREKEKLSKTDGEKCK